jgi:hypothetical protein
MAKYIFIPIMTPEMASIATKWNNERVAAGKGAYGILSVTDTGIAKSLRRTFGGGQLSGVAAGDTVWVLAHGISTPTSGGALAIGNKRGGQLQNDFVGGAKVVGGQWKIYRVDELAAVIEKEGLVKTFVDLRLFACEAGLPATHNGNPLQPFAQRLKNALVGRGYANVVVTGFLGDLVAGYSQYYAPGTIIVSSAAVAGSGLGIKVAGQTYRQRAKNHMVQF